MDDSRQAWGFALVSSDAAGAVLDAWFPTPALGSAPAHAAPPTTLLAMEGSDDLRRVTSGVVRVEIGDLDVPPQTPVDVWLRLHLLSHRLLAPQAQNLEGIFGLLTNVVWTDAGPCAVGTFDETQLRARAARRHLTVNGIDKFPRMTDYVVPSGVRIADASRVRLGAHLASGTTVMHEGFVNYNAGTLGTSMVEGRISAGVVVDDGSDIGGGASVMGTLSGGGKETIRIGKRCLLGANSGTGISLGDDCVVAAGCYITYGTKVTMPDGSIVKASTLSGQSGWQLWQNSVTGTVEAARRAGPGTELNETLHTHA